MNALATATALSDRDLLSHLDVLATKERQASVELVAHLAVLDSRPSLYAAQGCGSLFSYCTQLLRLSEDAACNRIDAARACRRFPEVLDLLASGALSLTSVRLLTPHLTPENHRAVLARASGLRRREIEGLVAQLALQPDVPSSLRKLPAFTVSASPASRASSAGLTTAEPATPAPSALATSIQVPSTPVPSTPAFLKARPVVQATAPQRYRVQFTIGQETHDKLRCLQALLRREVPDGDPGVLFDRALTLLLAKTEKAKLGATSRPRPAIRPAADESARNAAIRSRRRTRYIPRTVKRAVWKRDGGQCAFISATGRRCDERTFLEYHHLQPWAWQGPATVENIALHCRRHNHYEGELIFGPRPGDRDKRTPAEAERQEKTQVAERRASPPATALLPSSGQPGSPELPDEPYFLG